MAQIQVQEVERGVVLNLPDGRTIVLDEQLIAQLAREQQLRQLEQELRVVTQLLGKFEARLLFMDIEASDGRWRFDGTALTKVVVNQVPPRSGGGGWKTSATDDDVKRALALVSTARWRGKAIALRSKKVRDKLMEWGHSVWKE